jgi:hypothetical protein
LASRYSRLEQLQSYKADLERLGHEVTSRWVNGDHQAKDEQLADDVGFARHIAEEDLEDIRCADAMIAFTEEPRSGHTRGGRHVERGVALERGLLMFLVGPRENVFYCVPEAQHFAGWPAALAAVAALPASFVASVVCRDSYNGGTPRCELPAGHHGKHIYVERPRRPA